MLARRIQRGYLVYSLFAYVNGDIELPDIFFQVDIDNDGKIMLNEKETGWTLDDIIEDRKLKAEVLEKNEVYPKRPSSTSSKSPCHYCPFKALCDKWDKGSIKTTEDFLGQAKEIVNAAEKESFLNRQDRIGKAKEKFGG